MARTRVTFRIPPPLYLLHGARIPTDTPEGRYWVEFRIVLVGAAAAAAIQPIGGARVTMPRDTDGGLHNTLVTVESPVAHDIDPRPRALPVAQIVAVRVLNRFIDHYRVMTNHPALRRLEPRLASWLKYRVEQDDGRVREGTRIAPTGLAPGGEPADVGDADKALVAELTAMSWSSQPPYRMLHLDALADLAIAVYDSSLMVSALAHLFMSFEMLAWLAYAAVARTTVGHDAYEHDFAVDENGSPVSIRKVIRQLDMWVPSDFPSNNKRNSALDVLLKYRNDVMHGRSITYPVNEVAASFDAYAAFSPWLDRALSAAGGPTAAERPST